MKTLWTTLILILSASAFGQNMTWSQWYALTGKNKLVTTDANGEPSGSMGTISGTNVTLFGGLFSDDATITNLVKAGAINQGATKILTAGQHLTNIADIASSTAVAQVLSGTNTEFIGVVSTPKLVNTNQTISIGGITYTFPATNGLAGQFLVDDGTGFLTWTNVTAAAGGTTNLMETTISCASATLSPTFAVDGLSTTAASCRSLTMVCLLTNNVTTISAVAGSLISGDTMIWELVQDSVGTRTITGWDSSYGFSTNGFGITGINIGTNAYQREFITWKYNSSAGRWFCLGDMGGY